MTGNGTVDESAVKSPSNNIAAAFYGLFAVGNFVAAIMTGGQWLHMVGVVIFAVLALRSTRGGVFLDDAGLTARTDRFTRRLLWTELSGFECRRFGVGARTKDGRWVKLQDYGLLHRSEATATAERLEAVRRKYATA